MKIPPSASVAISSRKQGSLLKFAHRILIFAVVAVMGVCGPASPQTTINGQVGADVGSYHFSNFLVQDGTQYSVDRRLSNQFVDMGIAGPLVNGYFASYNARRY